jgi:hypothetical protein
MYGTVLDLAIAEHTRSTIMPHIQYAEFHYATARFREKIPQAI